jgi:hypothetical protein
MKLPRKPDRGKPVAASWGADVVDYLIALTPHASADILPAVRSTGTTFELLKKRSRRSSQFATSNHPYKPLMRTDPEDADAYQFGIYYLSQLYQNLDPDNTITITGLLNEAATTGWLDWLGSGTDKIWIEGTFTTWPTIDAVTVKSLGNGDTFDGGVVEHDGATPATQTKFRRVIATIDCEETPPVITPHVRSHLTLKISAYSPAKDSDGNNPALIPAAFPEAI